MLRTIDEVHFMSSSYSRMMPMAFLLSLQTRAALISVLPN